jgi:hypothetical protein
LATISEKKMRNLIYILIILLNFESINSQEMNVDYMLFSNSKENSEYIEFINDSVFIRKPYYSNSGCGLAYLSVKNSDNNENKYKKYRYSKKNDKITFFEFNNTENVEFIISKNNYFENSNTKEVYIKRKLFDKSPNLAVRYKEKYYWLDSPETSNGIITKNGKKNKQLSRILKNKDTSNVEILIYKEYNAFKKFGFEYVFGVIDIKEKKQ